MARSSGNGGGKNGSGKSGGRGDQSQDVLDNRSRQLDPEHDAYYQSRGEPGRPKGQGKDD